MTKILDIALADGRFYTFLDALKAARLAEVLEQQTPFTLLAPTDAAFSVLAGDGLSTLLADTAALTRILSRHVLPGRHMAAELLLKSPVTPLAGDPLSLRIDGDVLFVAEATVIMRDIEGDDGVMHVLDKIISST